MFSEILCIYLLLVGEYSWVTVSVCVFWLGINV